jgi:two-component system sensor histidine kinase VicK
MDNLQTVHDQMRRHLLSIVFLQNVVLIAVYWFASKHYPHKSTILLGGTVFLGLVFSIVIMEISSRFLISPLQALWQTILHISPQEGVLVAAPDLEKLRLGRELVTNLTGQIYQLSNITQKVHDTSEQKTEGMGQNFIANNLPLPLLVLDATETIQFVNKPAAEYLGMETADMVGKNVYMIMDMMFPNEATFDAWLKVVKQDTATASNSWDRVRLEVRDNHPERLFDLASYYNKDNPQHAETLMVLFDHTKQYSQDDQAVSFMALSVHELRTPLTMLRGYIEVFDEELEGKIDPELVNYMQKMKATSQQLTAFVNNILNVARIDDDQLVLKLSEEDWARVLAKAVDIISLRAEVRGIKLECTVAPGLPSVGIDRLSIQEVINNLIDNAIKYSGTSKSIKVESKLSNEGMVETTVQDFGVGMEADILPNLFTKFYRDHRNRAEVGGTGLGLYLSKAIVSAHGGNLWVRSKTGQGSTFGFTIKPYAQLAQEIKENNNQDIVRGAHGWIKNHSLYRR